MFFTSGAHRRSAKHIQLAAKHRQLATKRQQMAIHCGADTVSFRVANFKMPRSERGPVGGNLLTGKAMTPSKKNLFRPSLPLSRGARWIPGRGDFISCLWYKQVNK